MSTAGTIVTWQGLGALRTCLWRLPHWWTYGICAAAWWIMAAHALRFAAHGIHHRMSFSEEWLHWLLMVYAMMLPLISMELRAAAIASLWSRRHWAMFIVLCGYSVIWLAAGIPVALLRGQASMCNYQAAMIAFLLAAVWQFTPVHAYALAQCHRSPVLAPAGWRANCDCMLFGMRIGCACVLTCFPMMSACALTAHAPAAMLTCMCVGIAERRSFRARSGIPAIAALLLAAYYFVLA